MTVDDWRTRIAEIAAEVRALPRDLVAQHRFELALSRLWTAMRAPPPSVRQAFEEIVEDDLDREAQERAGDLVLRSAPPWSPDVGAKTKSLVFDVSVQIRALDKALYETRVPGRTDDPTEEFLAYGDEGVFILPRVAGALPEPRRGQLFDRRGLIHHRILPSVVNDVAIKLWNPSISGPGRDGSAADLVSIIYPKVIPDFVETPESFFIRSFLNEDELQRNLEGQLQDLLTGPACMAAVWPELTMSERRVEDIRSALAYGALDDDRPELGFVVAGSRHEPRSGDYVNVAQVISGAGRPLFEILKRERFQLRPGVLEQIVPGSELPVLVYGDVLIAFGICKDFCERRHDTPFRHLDVDLVIVPSFGDARTMDQHVTVAEGLNLGYGARALVVQQLLPAGDTEVWGAVLKPSWNPRQPVPASAPQNILLDRSRMSCTIS